MRLRIATMLDYYFTGQAQIIAQVEVAYALGQQVVAETLTFTPPSQLIATIDPVSGSRMLRGQVGQSFRIDYTALVDVGPRSALPATARQHSWAELPAEVLPYLLPSRFCPSDKFGRFVTRTFSNSVDGGARVLAILDWIYRQIDYTHGVSTTETTAEHTFVDRAGVCRDFAHLAVSLCRAANIPARVVAVYAWQLEPQDFHAVVEVFVGGGWWLVDPTRLAPIDGLVRIARGRDAADIAFMATDLAAQLIAMTVSVTRTDGDT
jgi:transglutaminase-like putative cysteine protease